MLFALEGSAARAQASSETASCEESCPIVEDLDDLRRRQMVLEEFAGRGRLVIQLRELPVTLRVVIGSIDDHDLLGSDFGVVVSATSQAADNGQNTLVQHGAHAAVRES